MESLKRIEKESRCVGKENTISGKGLTLRTRSIKAHTGNVKRHSIELMVECERRWALSGGTFAIVGFTDSLRKETMQFLKDAMEVFAILLMPLGIYICAGLMAVMVEFLWGKIKIAAVRLLKGKESRC